MVGGAVPMSVNSGDLPTPLKPDPRVRVSPYEGGACADRSVARARKRKRMGGGGLSNIR
eukprot:COSAG01_NODE_4457_length_5005_cov_27.959234_4_plen_59_part_00